MTNWITRDSGKREEYATGARRDIRTGKGRYDLLPPFAIHRVAGVYERGAAKYGDRNYEKGIPLTRYLDSALRHTFEVLQGKTDEDHAAQAAWNLLAFMQTQEMINNGLLPKDLNDLPNYTDPTPVEIQRDSIGGTPEACIREAVRLTIERAERSDNDRCGVWCGTCFPAADPEC